MASQHLSRNPLRTDPPSSELCMLRSPILLLFNPITPPPQFLFLSCQLLPICQIFPQLFVLRQSLLASSLLGEGHYVFVDGVEIYLLKNALCTDVSMLLVCKF